MASRIKSIICCLFLIIGLSITYDFSACALTRLKLENISLNIAHFISKNGGINEEVEKKLSTMETVSLVCLDNCNPQFGDVLVFKISKPVPLLAFDSPDFEVAVTWSVTIGY